MSTQMYKKSPFTSISATLRNTFFSEEAEDIDVIGLVVTLTIVAALLAVQMEFFGTEASKVLDRAQQYAILSMGVKVRGEIESSYAWNDAYRQWLDWESRASLAEQNGDMEAAKRYRVVRDRVTTLTPLLGSDYFDTTLSQPDLRAFESNTYLVESTALQERYIRSMELFDFLDTKSDAFSLQIQLLAVALALIALAPNQDLLPSRRLRRLPVLAAVILGAVVVVWSVRVFLNPVPIYFEEAVNNYAMGVGLSYQGDHVGAVAAFDQTLALEPDYANALYRRGNAHFALGNYEAAAADYTAAWDAGREELNVLWNLGWTYYIMGSYADAIKTTNEALSLDTEQVALYFNLGVMQLASGEVTEAQLTYEAGLQKSTQIVTQSSQTGDSPTSLWSYLNIAIEDIDAYLLCLETAMCENAPAHEMLTLDPAVQRAATEIRLDLKNHAVALEYMQAPPPAEVQADLGGLEFGTGVYDENGQLTDFLALGAEGSPLRFGLAIEEESSRVIDSTLTLANDEDVPVLVRFPYSQIQDKPLLVVKVFHNKSEALWLRIVESWNLGNEGEAVLPLNPSTQFALADGDYHVEIYLDGRLVQEGSFVLGTDNTEE